MYIYVHTHTHTHTHRVAEKIFRRAPSGEETHGTGAQDGAKTKQKHEVSYPFPGEQRQRRLGAVYVYTYIDVHTY